VQWKGRPIRSISLPAGEWSYSVRFAEVKAAITCGKWPSEFWAASESDQAYLMAYANTINLMAAVEAKEAKAEADRAGKRK
jgi:hypothetical protein